MSDNMIPWCGGFRPVAFKTSVVVKLRNGITEQCPAGYLIWTHNLTGTDIVAYRIADYSAPQNKGDQP